ncbi:MAG TPA: antibiotic biosynthesis monooxygenase [Xanthobacteraceae bacterium]|nr:antibiotic biosynthesis monooxygenase [Xanthobacteraceae bacterium]
MRVFCGMMLAIAVVAAAPVAMAQAPAGGTAYVVTYIEVTPSAQSEVTGLLKQVAAASRKEAGNERYDILQRIDRKNQFVILEAWTDLRAAEAHAGGDALKQFKEKLKPQQVSFYDERPSNGIAVAASPASIGKGAIFAVTHVDVTPPNKDDCIVMLKKLAEDSRKEPNSLQFEAWQQNNRANHFTVTEVWKNRAAIDSHIVTAGTKEFREKLGPMSGALYDERLYRSL